MTSKQRAFCVLNGEAPDRTPVFPLIMSFAAKGINKSYKEFASNAEVLAQAQINIAQKYNVDVITVCSDAFRISADLGGEIMFPDDTPPHLKAPLVKNLLDFKSLKRPDLSLSSTRCYDRARAVGLISKELAQTHAVFGWVDMPFAEACSLCGVQEFMMIMLDEPELAHSILSYLTELVIEFALLQMETGTSLVGAGDAAASLVSPDMYREFALPYEQRVINAIHAKDGIVKLHMCGNTTTLIDDMLRADADLYNIDHSVDFGTAVSKYSAAGKAVKGNLNPVLLLSMTPDECSAAGKKLIDTAPKTGYMLSAGCEIPPGVSDEVFKAFCDSALLGN